MASGKYVAYISSYTMQDKHGIRIFDVDMKNGLLIPKREVEITNSSYITISHNKEFLYSITDLGVETYKILEDGDLEFKKISSINGMRGCYISTDYTDSFLFVTGYHDGKLTVLHIEEDGTVGDICEEIYDKGLGIISEKNSMPHICCAKMTRDNQFLLVVDNGLDHVYVYKLNAETGKLKLVDVLHSEMESGPKQLKISKNGKFIYIVHQNKDYIDAYSYKLNGEQPVFEKIQNISTLNDYHASMTAATTLKLSTDYHYLLSANAGDNSVIVYEIMKEDGTLRKIFCLPISGDYPKDAAIFPDNKHLVSLNHESNTLSFFNLDLERGLIVLNGKPMKLEKPNCIIFHKLK